MGTYGHAEGKCDSEEHRASASGVHGIRRIFIVLPSVVFSALRQRSGSGPVSIEPNP